MRKKIKKWAKILAWSAGGLTLLVVVGYFVAAKYYLPRYFQENIIPELTKEAGIRGFSGKVTNVGAFGADLGEMVIGPADNPTLKAAKVTLAYSLQKSWSRGHLVIDQVVFNGVNLKCAIRDGQLVINGIDQAKILAELQEHFVKPKAGKLLTVQKVVIRKGLMELELNGRQLLIPFELFITPQDSNWNNLNAELKIEFEQQLISFKMNGHCAQGCIDIGFKGKNSLQKFVEIANVIRPGIVTNSGIYEGENSFHGEVSLHFKPKFSISEFKLNGILENGRIDTGDLSIRNITLRSGHKKQLSYSIIRSNGKFKINISDCRIQRPIVAEIKNFSGEFTLAEAVPVKFSGKIKLPLESLPLWRVFGVKPLYGINFDSQLVGSYNRQTKKWQFRAMPQDEESKDALYEWFFKYLDNYVFTTVKHLSIIGSGQGAIGEINIKLDIPKANLSGRQRMMSLRGFRLNEKLEINISKLMELSVKHLKGDLLVEHFSGNWDGNSWNSTAINLAGHADITPDLQLNNGIFTLKSNYLAMENRAQAFIGDTLTATGSVNFSLNNGNFLLNSLNGKLSADKVNSRHGDLRAELKKLKLQQRIEFDQGFIVNTIKNRLTSDEVKFFAGSSTITCWKTVLDTNMAKVTAASIEQTLKGDMTFSKVVCEMANGNKSVSSAGRVNFSLPVMAGSFTGNVGVKAMFPRCWYFAHTLKGRASGVKLDTQLRLKNIDSLQLTAINGNLIMAEAEISDSDYYLKFIKPNLTHHVALNPAGGYRQPDILKLQLLAPEMKGGYKESIINLNKLVWNLDHKADRKPALTTKLSAAEFSAKSFVTGSFKVPIFELTGQWNDTRAQGKLKFSNATGKLLKPIISGSGINAEIPLGWPVLPEKQQGKISAKNISYNGLTASKLELNIDSTPPALIFKGNFTNNISSGVTSFCFGKVTLPPAGFSIDADLSIPTYKTIYPINLGRFSPDWDGITFDGTLQGKTNINYTKAGFKYHTKLKLSDATLASADFSLKQLATTWEADNLTQSESHEYAAEFAAFEYDRLSLKNGKVNYRIDATGGLSFGRNTFQWLGSEAFVRPFTLKSNGSANLEIYCRKLPTTAILGFLGIKQVDCPSQLQGVIQMKLNNHAVTIDSAKLNSIPDKPVTIKIGKLNEIIKPRRGSEKDLACEMLQTGFRYNWLKLGFSMLPTVTTVSLQADGQPITAPPFSYNYDSKTFSRCEPSKSNISGEISLFTEIKLQRR
jgi:hypothetical protein